MDSRLVVEQYLARELQKIFDTHLLTVFGEAESIIKERATLYDVAEPVWHRVDWPVGFLQEVRKKIGRIRNEIAANKKKDLWPKMREEALDALNYLAFFVAFGDLLYSETESLGPLRDEVQEWLETRFVILPSRKRRRRVP